MNYYNNCVSVPLENTCYLKTRVVGTWEEARAQCWDWGGDLTLPLLSNKTTPKSWLQDSEEVWLGGRGEYHARPAIAPSSSAYMSGTYMACFSDLWRCVDNGGPYTDTGCQLGNCDKLRRGLCAIPPRR